MADVADPYERRGVPHPHELIPIETPEASTVGITDSKLYDAHVTEADRKRWREETAAREARRIRPGFYTGTEPRDDS